MAVITYHYCEQVTQSRKKLVNERYIAYSWPINNAETYRTVVFTPGLLRLARCAHWLAMTKFSAIFNYVLGKVFTPETPSGIIQSSS
ncbi:MAG: hypothetical protein K0R24_764 [Gammaproteobacteria bacterium]|jgi:hypothetical protein|nr:hypothetical protein [Gammaproteobacteria bacterium]